MCDALHVEADAQAAALLGCLLSTNAARIQTPRERGALVSGASKEKEEDKESAYLRVKIASTCNLEATALGELPHRTTHTLREDARVGSQPSLSVKQSSITRKLIERRWLVPVYRLDAVPMAWDCAVCQKLFSISTDEAQRTSSVLPPAHVAWEFRLHNCDLQLARHYPDPSL